MLDSNTFFQWPGTKRLSTGRQIPKPDAHLRKPHACPNDIPLSDLFSFIAQHAQRAFGYGADLDPSQRPPMSGFEE